jgi:hypothetical protein
MEQLLPHPILSPARLNRARFVSFRQFVWHVGWSWSCELELLILQAHEKKGQTRRGVEGEDGKTATPLAGARAS